MCIFIFGGFWEVVVFPLKQNQYNQIFHKKLNNEPIPISYEASQMVTHIDDNTVLQKLTENYSLSMVCQKDLF